jgi:hypothetical protein
MIMNKLDSVPICCWWLSIAFDFNTVFVIVDYTVNKHKKRKEARELLTIRNRG